MLEIKKFWVTKMTVAGFRGYTTPQTFNFSPMTEIIGDNGLGKSSVGEAIAFAITGAALFGGKWLDCLYHGEDRDITVDLEIIDGDKQPHRIYRRRHGKNDKMDVTFDGMVCRQKDLDAIFGERDLVLSIFNPLYLIECLGDSAAALFERYLPVIPEGRIKETLSDADRKVLEDIDMVSPEGLIQNTRREVRELTEKITYLTGQGDLLESQKLERSAELAAAQETLNAARAKLAQLTEKRFDSIDIQALNDTLIDLYARNEELCHEGVSVSTAEVDAEIQKAVARREQAKARPYQSRYTQRIAEFDAQINTLRDNFTRARKMVNGLKPGLQCPTCRQTVTEDNIEAIRNEWKTAMDEAESQGKVIAEQREELQTFDETALDTFKKFVQDDIEKAEMDLKELNERREAMLKKADAGDREEEKAQLALQIRAAEELRDRGNLPEEEWAAFNSLTASIPHMESIVARLSEESSYGAEDTTVQIAEQKESIDEKERLIEAVTHFLSQKAIIQYAGLKENRVAISLYDVVKGSGERRDTFKFTYNDKPYSVLSLSEKIKAGLEASVMLQRLTGRCYPVFIDNTESISVIDNVKPSGQCILVTKVTGEPLRVQPYGQHAEEARQAAAVQQSAA